MGLTWSLFPLIWAAAINLVLGVDASKPNVLVIMTDDQGAYQTTSALNQLDSNLTPSRYDLGFAFGSTERYEVDCRARYPI